MNTGRGMPGLHSGGPSAHARDAFPQVSNDNRSVAGVGGRLRQSGGVAALRVSTEARVQPRRLQLVLVPPACRPESE
jgi:hypothetical protein